MTTQRHDSRRRTGDRTVYVAYTGGTIGMRATDAGYAPEPG